MPGWLRPLGEWIAGASPRRRLMLALLVLLPPAALGLAWFQFAPADYRQLYPQLSDRAAGEVLVALDQLGIAYRLSRSDGGIEVPAADLHAARYRLAAQGLPRSDEAVQAEADAAPRFGATSQQEAQRTQRALENELAHSIRMLDAVELARVHLALPRVSPFLRGAAAPTAAVLVRLKPGMRLTAEQATTIRTLVAAAVPHMQPGDVQVLGPRGVLIGAVPEVSGSRKLALEQEMRRRVLAVLTPWLGHERVNVQINASLAEDDTRQTVERVRRVVIAGSAQPLEKTVRTTNLPEGRLTRIDALVVLGFEADAPQRRRVEQLARQALGLSQARGDTLKVYVLPTAAPPRPAPPALPAQVLPESGRETVGTPSAPEPDTAFSRHAGLLQSGLVLAGLVLAGLLVAWRRRRPVAVAAEEAGDEDFDALLDAARRQTLEDPRVTADVVKLWMRA